MSPPENPAAGSRSHRPGGSDCLRLEPRFSQSPKLLTGPQMAGRPKKELQCLDEILALHVLGSIGETRDRVSDGGAPR